MDVDLANTTIRRACCLQSDTIKVRIPFPHGVTGSVCTGTTGTTGYTCTSELIGAVNMSELLGETQELDTKYNFYDKTVTVNRASACPAIGIPDINNPNVNCL